MPLKIKRAALFSFVFFFFLLPGQNYYQTIQAQTVIDKLNQPILDLPQPAAYPVKTGSKPTPILSALAVEILDVNSGIPIYQKNENTNLLPASTTKIMTALVALDHYQLDQALTVNQVNNLGQDMKLFLGEQMTFRNLLYGLLVFSANDAAWVLAQNYPGGPTAFIQAMNQKADLLNLTETHFANPTGINSDIWGNFLADFSYTTARDLVRLTQQALRNPIFKQAVATEKITVTDISGVYQHRLVNLNELLGKIEGLKGVKTGWTEDASGCLVTYIDRPAGAIIVVVLGSADRFGETASLINWVYNNYSWQNVAPILQ